MADLKIITVDFTLPTSSGDFDITTTELGGRTPKAAWFMNSRATTLGTAGEDYFDEHGFTDGTNEYCVTAVEETDNNYNDTNSQTWDDRVLSETYLHGARWAASFVQWLSTDDTGTDETGVRLNLDSGPSSAWKGQVVFLAGDDLDVEVGHTTVPNSGTNSASLDFEADVVLMMTNGTTSFGTDESSAYFSFGWSVNDGTTNGDMVCNAYSINESTSSSRVRQTLGTDYCAAQVHRNSSDINFTVRTTNWSSTGFDLEAESGSPDDAIVPWMAIRWGSQSVESAINDIRTSDSGTHSLVTYSFEPSAGIFLTTGLFSTNTPTSDSDSMDTGQAVIDQNGNLLGRGCGHDYGGASVSSMMDNLILRHDDDGSNLFEASFSQYLSDTIEIDISTSTPNDFLMPLLVFQKPETVVDEDGSILTSNSDIIESSDDGLTGLSGEVLSSSSSLLSVNETTSVNETDSISTTVVAETITSVDTGLSDEYPPVTQISITVLQTTNTNTETNELADLSSALADAHEASISTSTTLYPSITSVSDSPVTANESGEWVAPSYLMGITYSIISANESGSYTSTEDLTLTTNAADIEAQESATTDESGSMVGSSATVPNAADTGVQALTGTHASASADTFASADAGVYAQVGEITTSASSPFESSDTGSATLSTDTVPSSATIFNGVDSGAADDNTVIIDSNANINSGNEIGYSGISGSISSAIADTINASETGLITVSTTIPQVSGTVTTANITTEADELADLSSILADISSVNETAIADESGTVYGSVSSTFNTTEDSLTEASAEVTTAVVNSIESLETGSETIDGLLSDSYSEAFTLTAKSIADAVAITVPVKSKNIRASGLASTGISGVIVTSSGSSISANDEGLKTTNSEFSSSYSSVLFTNEEGIWSQNPTVTDFTVTTLNAVESGAESISSSITFSSASILETALSTSTTVSSILTNSTTNILDAGDNVIISETGTITESVVSIQSIDEYNVGEESGTLPSVSYTTLYANESTQEDINGNVSSVIVSTIETTESGYESINGSITESVSTTVISSSENGSESISSTITESSVNTIDTTENGSYIDNAILTVGSNETLSSIESSEGNEINNISTAYAFTIESVSSTKTVESSSIVDSYVSVLESDGITDSTISGEITAASENIFTLTAEAIVYPEPTIPSSVATSISANDIASVTIDTSIVDLQTELKNADENGFYNDDSTIVAVESSTFNVQESAFTNASSEIIETTTKVITAVENAYSDVSSEITSSSATAIKTQEFSAESISGVITSGYANTLESVTTIETTSGEVIVSEIPKITHSNVETLQSKDSGYTNIECDITQSSSTSITADIEYIDIIKTEFPSVNAITLSDPNEYTSAGEQPVITTVSAKTFASEDQGSKSENGIITSINSNVIQGSGYGDLVDSLSADIFIGPIFKANIETNTQFTALINIKAKQLNS